MSNALDELDNIHRLPTGVRNKVSWSCYADGYNTVSWQEEPSKEQIAETENALFQTYPDSSMVRHTGVGLPNEMSCDDNSLNTTYRQKKD